MNARWGLTVGQKDRQRICPADCNSFPLGRLFRLPTDGHRGGSRQPNSLLMENLHPDIGWIRPIGQRVLGPEAAVRRLRRQSVGERTAEFGLQWRPEEAHRAQVYGQSRRIKHQTRQRRVDSIWIEHLDELGSRQERAQGLSTPVLPPWIGGIGSTPFPSRPSGQRPRPQQIWVPTGKPSLSR